MKMFPCLSARSALRSLAISEFGQPGQAQRRAVLWLLAFLMVLPLTTSRVMAQAGVANYVYNPVTITAGGYVPDIIAHPTEPGLIYARTDIGSVYRWQPQTKTWLPLTDFHSPDQYNWNGPESIALDPTDPSRLYIAAGMYAYPNCCAFLVSTDQGATFQTYPAPFEMASNNDGRAAGERLAVNPYKPKQLFMGTRFNGLWMSENYAQTWTQVKSFPVQSSTDGYGVQFVVFDPKRPDWIYAGSYTNATLYLSKDDGATWAAVPGQPTTWPASYNVPSGTLPPAPERAVINSDGNLYVNFDDLPGPDNINYGMVQSYNPETQKWTDVTPPIDAPEQSGPRGGFVGMSQDLTKPGTVAVSTMDRWYPVDTVYVTHDSGASWVNLGLTTALAGDDGNPYGNYYYDPSVYVPYSPWLSFGNSNYPLSPYPSAKFGWWISGLLIDPTNPEHLMFGTGATIYATDNVSVADTGAPPTWFVQAKGIEETAILALISPNGGAHLLSGMGDIGGFRHVDFTVSPKAGMYTNPVSGSTGSLDWAGRNPNFIVRSQSPSTSSTSPCNYGAYSVDNGAQWQPFPSCAANVNTGNGGTISVDAGDAVLMWTPPYSGVTQFSLDRGTTWTDVTGLPATTPVYADKVRPFVFYAYANGNFYSTIVNGSQNVAAFSQVNATELPASNGCYGSGCGVVTANFAKAADLWLPLGSNGLYHSLDGGVTWIKLGKVAYANSVAVGAASPTSQYESVFLYGEPTAGSAMAIYRSDDNGSTWVRINDDAHQYGGPTLIQADPRVYGRVYLGMNGRGIIYGDIAQ